MSLYIPQRWKKQPAYPVGLDQRCFPSLPSSAMIGGFPIDVVSNSHPTFGPTVHQSVTQDGRSYRVEDGSDYIELAADADDICGTTAGTYLYAVTNLTIDSAGGNAWIGYMGGASDRAAFELDKGSNAITWDYGNATTGSGRLQAQWIAPDPHSPYTFVGLAGQRGREIWVNGELLGSNSGTASRSSTDFPFRIGIAGSTLRRHDMLGCVIFKEALPQELCQEYSANFWSVFESISAKIYSFPAGVAPADKRGIILGSTTINAMNLGNTAINKAYIGSTEIFN